MTEEDHPHYKIMLQNEAGDLRTYDAQNFESETDYAKLLNYDQSLSYADYSASIDIASLPVGTYRMYIVIANDSYTDIEELYSFYYKQIDDYSINGKTYSLSTSNVHGRFILEVSE